MLMLRARSGLCTSLIENEFMPFQSLKRRCRRLLFLLCLSSFINNSFSQSDETPLVAWFFPGVTYKVNSRLDLRGQYFFNHRQTVQAVYLQAFLKAGRHFIINPAYMYLNIDRNNGTPLDDHTLMSSVIYTFNINKLVVDDRNMLWS